MIQQVLELLIRVKGDTQHGLDDVEKGMKGVKQQAEQASNALNGLSASLGPVGEMLSGIGLAGIASAAQIAVYVGAVQTAAEAVVHLVEVSSHIKDLSDRVGIGAEALQEFGYAAKLTGTSMDAFVTATKNMQVNLVENEERFRRLGLSIAELRDLKPEQQFMAVAEAIRAIQDPAQQTAAAVSIFGRNATAVLPAIKEGMAGLAQEARDLGGVIGTDTVNAADDLGDAATRLDVAWEGLKNQLAAVIVKNPELTAALNDVAKGIGAIAGIITDNRDVIQDFFNLMFGNALKGAATITTRFRESAQDVENFIEVLRGIEDVLPEVKGAGGENPFAAIWENATKEATKSVDKQLAEAKRAADEMERLAKRDADVWMRAAEQARKEWDKFFLDMQLRGIRTLGEMQKDINKSVADAAKQNEARILGDLAARKAALDDWHGALLEMQAASDQAFEDMLNDLQMVADSMFELGDAVGGTAGDFLRFGAGAIQVLINLNDQALRSASNLQKMAGVLQGATAAFKSGSVFGGAMSGAAAGAAFGPIGAGIGAAVGGIIGFFGSKKKKREEEERKRQEAAAKQLEDQKKRVEGISRAMEGLALRTKGWADAVAKGTISGAQAQAGFDRLGRSAVAQFAAIVRETGDAVGALNQMGDTLDVLVKAQQDHGLAASTALQTLLSWRSFLTLNEEIAQQMQGLNMEMAGMEAAGIRNAQMYQDWGATATEIYDQMIAKGMDANQALAIQQPTLQRLWEAQKDLGVQYDETTQRMLDQAEQQGLVGDQMRDVNEQILQVLLAMADAIGAQIPAALRRMGDEADQQFGRMRDGAASIGPSVPHWSPGDLTDSGDGGYGSYASGFYSASLPRDHMFMAHRGERVEITPADETRRSGGEGPSTIVVPVSIGWQKLDDIIIRRNRAGFWELAK